MTVELWAAAITGTTVCVIAAIAMIAGAVTRSAPRRAEYQDYRPAAPLEPVPILYDIPHPERYPKTWAYRAAKGAEPTTEIVAEGYRRSRNRRLNGEDL